MIMTEAEKKELKDYLAFLRSAVGESQHQCDDETMEWHYEMMEKLKKILSL